MKKRGKVDFVRGKEGKADWRTGGFQPAFLSFPFTIEV
jgi:hypothetical protein